MGMDPGSMFKVMGAINKFKSNHPKFVSFVTNIFNSGIEEDTIIELTVTKPGQEPVTTNIKVKKTDLELFEALKGGM